ncbi:MAG TPA: sugar transferase [Bacteroidia bacterium]|nr:sugar transferase [Bacteroidia bacterium]
MKKRQLIFISGDIIVVTASFLFFVYLKPASLTTYLPNYLPSFLFYLFFWVLISVVFGKYKFVKKNNYILSLSPILRSNVVIIAIISIIMIASQKLSYSRLVFFGTYFSSFFLEIVLTLFFFYNKRLTADADKAAELEIDLEDIGRPAQIQENGKEGINILTSDPSITNAINSILAITVPEEKIKEIVDLNRQLIERESGKNVYQFISRFIDITSLRNLIFSTTSTFNIEKQPFNDYESLINLHRINDVRRINKFLEAVNQKLRNGGIFIGCLETKDLRKRRIFSKLPPGISHIYYFFDFIYKRVMPKLFLTRKLYFFLNQGHNRVLSQQEMFGRLYSCGFKLLEEKVMNGLLYFVAKKIKEPVYDFNPSYGALFKMRRIGKNGKVIYVYKFRTMYPYSEYLQEFVYERFNLAEGGKFANDYRITTLGRFMRKYWLDELPMFINFFRGDLKLVGVRPLSAHYLNLYSEEVRNKRLKTKPGLIPPYYADMPKTLEEIQKSELNYLEQYFKNPILTDIKYFFLAMYNIIFKNARSK